ncbi:MAG: hypothetical protein AB7N76_32045 [Planctomycetota bacterium]
MSAGIRKLHRWVSLAFTAGMVLNVAAFAFPDPPVWLGVFAFLPMVVLLLTGLYLLVLPLRAADPPPPTRGVRRFHRWVSAAFSAAVVLNMVAWGFGQPPAWAGLLALVPLLLLLATGLYLFVRPTR